MATARFGNDGWIRCGECGHKLGRQIGDWKDRQSFPAIEIKCHSCRSLNYVMIGGQGNEGSRSRSEATETDR